MPRSKSNKRNERTLHWKLQKMWQKKLKKTQTNRKQYHIHGLEDSNKLILYANQCSPNRDSSSYSVEIEKLILKFIWKCSGPRKTKTVFKMIKKKLEDSHYQLL